MCAEWRWKGYRFMWLRRYVATTRWVIRGGRHASKHVRLYSKCNSAWTDMLHIFLKIMNTWILSRCLAWLQGMAERCCCPATAMSTNCSSSTSSPPENFCFPDRIANSWSILSGRGVAGGLVGGWFTLFHDFCGVCSSELFVLFWVLLSPLLFPGGAMTDTAM